MAYSRFGEYDVYLWLGPSGFECSACRLTDKEFYTIEASEENSFDEDFESEWYSDVILEDRDEVIEHLREHLVEGHKVPDHVFSRLKYGY